MLARGIVGIIEASATLRPERPCTRPCWSTTASGLSAVHAGGANGMDIVAYKALNEGIRPLISLGEGDESDAQTASPLSRTMSSEPRAANWGVWTRRPAGERPRGGAGHPQDRRRARRISGCSRPACAGRAAQLSLASSVLGLSGGALQPEGFAIVGMAALFTGIVRVPLTGLVLELK